MTSNSIAKALTFLAGILLVFAAHADINSGLVAYWSLSEGTGASTVADLTGNGNTGTLINFTDTTYNNMWTSPGDPNNGWPFAMQFNQSGEGANTYINVPDSSTLNAPSTNKSWTLAAWVRCSEAGTAEPRFAGIIAKGNQASEAYALYMNDTAGTGKFCGDFHNVGLGGGEVATSTTVAQAGVWYHVAVTVLEPLGSANAEAILYVNGVRESGANANTYTTVYSTNLPVTIGCRRNSSGNIADAFAGSIDDVRIYSRALSASDIAQLYNNKAFAPNNSGIGLWNGLAGSSGNATLDTTSLNFSTNIYSAPLGTAASLGNVLTLDNGSALPPSITFGSYYYSNSLPIAVGATNLTVAAGGIAAATANGAGTVNFANYPATTYILNSSDSIGIKDGANQTSLVQSGTGTAILTGINTFSGGVTINSGTVQAGNGGTITGQELGTGSVTDNGTLVFKGNNNASFNSTISGTGVVSQKGLGTVTVTGANTYTGGTTISNGAISINSLNDAGSPVSTGSITLSGGGLNYTGTGDSTARQFTGIAGTTNTIDVMPGANLEITGRVTGSAAWVLNKVDSGTLTLSGAADNSFLGMNVNAGTVILNKASASNVHAIGNPLTVNNGGTVQLAGSSNFQIANSATCPVTVNIGGVFDANGQSQTFNKLTLSGTGSGSGALINSAASTTSTLTVPVVLAGNATIGGAGTIALPSVVSGTGGLTYAGSAILTLGAVNTYTGTTVVSSGLVDATLPGSIPGNATVNGTGTLQLDDPSTLPPTAVVTLPTSPGTGIVNLNFFGTQTVSALVIGATSLPGGTYGAPGSGATFEDPAFQGSGLLFIAQTFWDANHTDASSQSSANGGGSGNWNNSTANWWVSGNADAIWSAGNVAYFSGTAGTVTLSDNVTAAGLTFTAPNYNINNTDGTSALTLSGAAPTVTIPQGTTTIGCALTGSGTVTVGGLGTLNLSGANTYTGGTTIAGGTTVNANTIADSGSSSLGVGGGGIVTLGTVGAQGANLNFTGTSGLTASQVTLNGTNSSVLNVPSGSSLELDGQVKSGTTTAAPLLTFNGGGTLTMGGSGDNAALTMAIQKGSVIINKNSATTVHGLGGGVSSLGTGTPGNSAVLQLSGTGGFDLFSTCVLTVNSPDGMLDLNGQSDSMSTLTLSGSGPTGVGALINSAAATTSLLNNAGSGVVLNGATTIGGVGDIELQGKVTGGGTLTYGGTGSLILSNANTYSGGTVINAGGTVVFANNASSAGAGAVTVNNNGTLGVALIGNNVIFPNTINGTGTVNLMETSANNLQLGGSMSGFTGVLNCPTSPGGTAKAQILTTGVNINSAATINVAAGGTLYLANGGVTIACPINLYGIGNSESYGALRIENGALISGPVTLFGDTTIGNGQAGSAKFATISGPIQESGGSHSLTFTPRPGTIILTGVSTYSGPTTLNQGPVIIGGAGQLGGGNYAGDILNNASNLTFATTALQTLSGVISGSGMLIEGGPGTLTLTGADSYTGDTWVTNGSTLVIAGSGSLGFGNYYTGNILDNGTFMYASSVGQVLSGTISGTGGVTVTGASTLSLNGANSYTGNTLITNGATLVLGGSLDTSASVSIGSASTLDVTTYDSYTMSASTTLQASGTGTGATAATIKGGSSVTLGSVALNFKPQSFSGDASHPALYVSASSLALNGNGPTVNNATGTPLGIGTYSLIQVSGGTLSLANNNVTVTGTGLSGGTTASLSIASGSLNLVVASGGTTPQPKITNIAFSNGNVVFSGTNGLNNGTYYVLATTNVALSPTNWTSIATNNFDATGNFTVTNSPQGTAQRFYLIDIRSP